MKTAYFCTTPIPSQRAAGVHIMNMCNAFAQNGHAVRLYVPDYPSCRQAAGTEHAFYGVQDSFPVLRKLYPRFRGRSLVFALACAHDARRSGVDLAYGRDMISLACASILGLPTVFESHWPPQEMAGIERLCFRLWCRHRNALRLVVVSQALADLFDPTLGPEVCVAHDAADVNLFFSATPDSEGEWGQKPLRVGYAGNLGSGRGESMILRLARQFPDCEFRVAGAGESLDSVQAAPENLRFYGFLRPAELPQFLANCDVLVAPFERAVRTAGGVRRLERWFSPMKLFEYMAAGKAIIVSDLPVLREVLSENEVVFVPPEGPDTWADALEALRSPQRRERLGLAARELVVARYTWRARAETVIQGIF